MSWSSLLAAKGCTGALKSWVYVLNLNYPAHSPLPAITIPGQFTVLIINNKLLSNNPPGHVDNNTPATAPATLRPPSAMGLSSDTHEADSDATASPSSTATRNRVSDQWTDAGKENDDGLRSRIFPPVTKAKVISQQPHLGRDAPRSLLLSNLAEGTSHADITSAVRGGQLLEVFMRPQGKYANVSFVHAQDAGAFYEYVRRHGLYISQKRVRDWGALLVCL